MTLLDIRTQFVKISGRYDLVVDAVDYVDNGANYYINAGMKMLDRMVEVPESTAKLYYALGVGEYSVTFQKGCRAIKEIWINNVESRTQLERVTLNELKEYYYELASATDTGTPSKYALAELRALETTDRDSLGVFINKTWDEVDTNYNYRGIIIVPPADEAYVVEVSGLFKQVVLAADADENYWIVEEDDLLLRAALYKLEGLSRGTENAKNWLSAIRDDVRLISNDLADEESFNVIQMEG